jgi:hypothetical protein
MHLSLTPGAASDLFQGPTLAELELQYVEAPFGQRVALEDVREGQHLAAVARRENVKRPHRAQERPPVLRLLAGLVDVIPPRPADAPHRAGGRRAHEAEDAPEVVGEVHLCHHVRLLC